LNLFKAFLLPYQAIGFTLKNRSLWRYILIPFLIDLLISLALIYFVLLQIPSIGAWLEEPIAALKMIPSPESWFGRFMIFCINIMDTLLHSVLYVIVVMLFPVFLTMLSAIIDPFFRTGLYNKVNELYLDSTNQNVKLSESHGSHGTHLKASYRAIINSFRIIYRFIVYYSFGLIAGFIPLIGGIFPVMVVAFFMAWEFLLISFEENNIAFEDQTRLLRKNFFTILMFGLGGYLLLFIPVLQALFLSTNVVAGSQLYRNLKPVI